MNANFHIFDLNRPGIEPVLTVSVADALNAFNRDGVHEILMLTKEA